MEIGNVSQRQQPEHRPEKDQMPPMSCQHSKTMLNAEAFLSLSLNNSVKYSANMDVILNSETYRSTNIQTY